jgi:hypothetical protein
MRLSTGLAFTILSRVDALPPEITLMIYLLRLNPSMGAPPAVTLALVEVLTPSTTSWITATTAA